MTPTVQPVQVAILTQLPMKTVSQPQTVIVIVRLATNLQVIPLVLHVYKASIAKD